jgi:hypothetical protein
VRGWQRPQTRDRAQWREGRNEDRVPHLQSIARSRLRATARRFVPRTEFAPRLKPGISRGHARGFQFSGTLFEVILNFVVERLIEFSVRQQDAATGAGV